MLQLAAWFTNSIRRRGVLSPYNPFTRDMLNRVLRNIDASFSSTDRRAWLIYKVFERRYHS